VRDEDRDVYVLHENVCCVLIQITRTRVPITITGSRWIERERDFRETDDEMMTALHIQHMYIIIIIIWICISCAVFTVLLNGGLFSVRVREDAQ
jgi:hypothetical protein